MAVSMYPMWTREVKLSHRRLDPLGLSRVSQWVTDQLQVVISSFLMINKLCIWLVKKAYQNIEYLRFVRLHTENLCLKYIDIEDPEQRRILSENKLFAYIIMFWRMVDFYQSQSPKFRGIGRNYVKEVFDFTFVEAIQLLRKTGEETLKSDLEMLGKEFSDISPEIDYSIEAVLRRLNETIKNVNRDKLRAYPPFSM